MNCPKCKKRLETRRTTLDGADCKREKLCRKCKRRYFTVEIFLDKYEQEKRKHQDELYRCEAIKDKIEDKYNDLTQAISTIVKSIPKR